MPQALITVNGTPGSNTSLPINTLVQLNNQNIGGETSYGWTILDQPPGTADVLSSAVAQNPTFTPKKEGTYLIRLIVNQGDPSEQENRVVCAVRQLKTGERVPAAGETNEADAAEGWAAANNSVLRRIDVALSDPGIIVGVNASGGALGTGRVVRATASSVIKSGLPGQETVPGFSGTDSTVLGNVDEMLCVVVSDITGNSPVANGALMKVRYIGRYPGIAGAPAVGDTVYVNDAGVLSTTPGTVRRQMGSVMSVGGGTYDVWVDGVGGADITPIDRAYVVQGNPGTLVNAIRVDGSNASGLTTPFRLKAGNVGTVPFQVEAFTAGADLTQWLASDGTTVLLKVDINGDIHTRHFSIQDTGTHVMAVSDGASTWTFNGNGNHSLFQTTNGTVLSGYGDTNAFGPTVGLVGTFSAHDFHLFANSAPQWGIDHTTGDFTALNANQRLKNITDPTAAQDAATKNYVDSHTSANITYGTNWSKGAFAQAAVVKTADGIVHLEGAFTNNTSNTAPGTVPVGFRPTHTLFFSILGTDLASNFGPNLLTIDSAGNISLDHWTHVSPDIVFWVDGLSYRTT